MGVFIKPLEWVRKDGGFAWTAGAYAIRDDGDGYEVDFCGVNLAYVGHNSCPLPLTEAKGTAQQHHEDYILSALQPGDGWQDGIRQLLDADRAFMDAKPLTEAQRELAQQVATAAAYGSAAFMAGMDQDQGTHAMLRAFLTALLDPLDPMLDYLRADPAAGEKARADRAAPPASLTGETQG